MKWSYATVSDAPVLGVASADASLAMYKLSPRGQLQECANVRVPNDTICLSLDWNNRVSGSATPTVAVSQADSNITLWRYGVGGDMVIENQVREILIQLYQPACLTNVKQERNSNLELVNLKKGHDAVSQKLASMARSQ